LVDESISLDPSRKTNKVAYTVRVAVLVDRGKVESAVREANALLAENPGDPAVLNAAGRALHALARKTGDNSYRERAASCFAQAKRA